MKKNNVERDLFHPITINKERAKTLCRVVLDAYEKRRYLFTDSKIERKMCPEKQMIAEIEYEGRKVKWLFFATSTMERKNSEQYFKEFREFYLENPCFFDKENLKKLSQIDSRDEEMGLSHKIKEHINLGLYLEPVRRWIFNAKKLLSDFEGDPLKIINKHIENLDILEELKKFKGLGTKQAKMYLIFLAKHGFADIDVYGLGPAIDHHFIKISAACGIYTFNDGIRVDTARNQLDKLYTKISREEELNSLILDSALWIIGHELCTKNNNGVCKVYCPLDDYCSKNLPKINRKDARLYQRKKPSKRSQLALPLKRKNAP